MFLRNPFVGAFGLDISDLSLKLVQLKRHSSTFGKVHYEVKEIRGVNLLPGCIVDGELQHPETVRKKLLILLGKEGKNKPIKSPWVVADLPEPKTFLKLVEIEIAPEEITSEDIEFHAKKHLPVDIGDAYLDWQIVKGDDKAGKTSVLIGAVAKVIADSYTYLLESAGLNIMALEIEALSIARAMITSAKDYCGQARIILDLGAVRSGLIIYDHNTIQFSTNIPFSGNLVNTALAQGLGISFEQAEAMKMENGLSYNKKNPKYLKIITELTDILMQDIKKTITFYEEHFNDTNKISHITMCGGMSSFKNLDKEITKKLKITTAPGHSWKNLQTKQMDNADPTMSLSLASAIGLGLRAAQDPFKEE